MSESTGFTTEEFVSRDQGRDLMANTIDAYMSEGGEFRAYDLADRLQRKLNQGGWWFVHGGDVERMISQEHPFNVKMAEREQALYSAALRVAENAYGSTARHTKGRNGQCRDDCVPCGIDALRKLVDPEDRWKNQ